MKAVMIEKPWDIKVVEREVPQLKDGEALIKVKAAGICGSDIGAFRGTNNLVSYPRVIGHEIAGEIVALKGDNPKGNGGGRLDPNALRIIDNQDAHSTKNRNASEVNWDDNLVPK